MDNSAHPHVDRVEHLLQGLAARPDALALVVDADDDLQAIGVAIIVMIDHNLAKNVPDKDVAIYLKALLQTAFMLGWDARDEIGDLNSFRKD